MTKFSMEQYCVSTCFNNLRYSLLFINEVAKVKGISDYYVSNPILNFLKDMYKKKYRSVND